MSKTYIVSRNGGTVTKAPINDNKIPIYANETALDADLANIPDNTLVATSSGHDDVIDQMKDYIRKQNVLSDWEDVYGTWVTSNSPSDVYNVPYDGFLTFSMPQNSSVGANYILYLLDDNGVNWKNITYYQGGNSGIPITVAVKKGWKLYGAYISNTFSKVYASFYKLRDYTGR